MIADSRRKTFHWLSLYVAGGHKGMRQKDKCDIWIWRSRKEQLYNVIL